MPFVIGCGFVKVQILIKVNLALSLEHSCNISITFCIQIDIGIKIQPKILPNVICHMIWLSLCRGKKSKITKLAITHKQC